MKRIKTILAAAIALSLCGCAQSAGEHEQNEQGIFEAIPDIQQMVNRPSIDGNMVAAVPVVEETENTCLAVDFIHDFYETLAFHDENALDLDKYFDEGELKERMAECKKTLLNKTTFSEKECFAIDYAEAVSDKAADGVHFITVAYTYNYRLSSAPYDPENPEEGWSGSGMGAPFAIKDGKIINLAIDDLFDPLPSDVNVPEVQVITSHITAARNGAFELDGITYESDTDRCSIIIEDGGFIKLLTPEGRIEPDDYNGAQNEAVDAVKEFFSLENLGNTGRLEAGDITITDATVYRFGEKLLLLAHTPTDPEIDQGGYCTALLFAPATESTYKPFEGKKIEHVEVHCRYDRTAELSEEDMQTLVGMLARVEFLGEGMNSWDMIPNSGNNPASFTIFFGDGENSYFSAERSIGYPDGTIGCAYIMDGKCYAADEEALREITDFYSGVLVGKYFPEYGQDYKFVPFVDTNAANLAYIEIVLDGLDAYREDGTFVEPERISDEEAAAVFELLQQIIIDKPPLSRYTWAGTPDGGYGSVFNVYYYVYGYSVEPSCMRVIPSSVHLPDGELSGGIILNSMCFPIDYELSSQLSACYHELYKKYYPDLYAKWYPTTDEA